MKKLLSFAASLAFLLASPSPSYAAETATPTGIPLSEIGSRIDALVASYMREFAPGLAVAVVKDGEIIFSRGYGYADAARRIPVDPAATVFSHASIGKMFVYVSVMQLVERGLLDLDSDINTYLPADLARRFNFRHSFTIRDLLNHSAGFGEVPFNGFQNAEAVRNRKTLREGLLAIQPIQIYQPGTAKAYSNFGIALAGYIVGHVSGMGFADFERANILEPLGMANTRNQPHWFGDSAFAQNRARGHRPDGSGGFVAVPWTYMHFYPAGALAGTVEDLARFAIALTPPRGEPSPLFNNRNTLDLMLSPSYDYRRSSGFRGTNHGFLTYAAVYPTLGHGGNLPGFTTNFEIVPSQRFGLVVLSNATDGGRIVEKIFDLVIGCGMDAALPVIENLPDAASVAGSFLFLRRTEGNIMEGANNLTRNWRVDAIDENTITLTWVVPAGMGPDIVITYRQIAPYLFRAISATDDARSMARGMYEIYFIMENGSPVKISTSWIADATLQTFGQTMTAFMISMAISGASALFFLAMSVAVLVSLLRRKGKGANAFTRLSNGLLFCGALFSVNWLVFEARYMMTMETSSFRSLAFATPHVVINIALLVLSVAAFAASLAFFRKAQIPARRKVLYFSTVAFLALFIFNVWQWNFFAMV